jgi:hypothetical protein
MLIQRLLSLALLFLMAPLLAEAAPESDTVARNGATSQSPQAGGSMNNGLNGNLNNGLNGNLNSPLSSATESAPPSDEALDEPEEPAPFDKAPEPSAPRTAPGEAVPESEVGPGELEVPPEGLPKRPASAPMPSRGMTMTEVENQFGKPKVKRPAVGDPPISRWAYADYTVYFERQYVLHSVPNDTKVSD